MSEEADPRYEQGTSSHKIPITPKTLPTLIRLGLALRKADKTQDLDADSPGLVMFDEHSSALLEHAQLLASDDREDDEAVSELVAMAKRHGRALRVAALGARQGGQHRESSFDNLTHRLLQAVNDAPVEPASTEERARLEKLDAFRGLPSAEQWRELVTLEPRLAGLEADARAGVFGRRRLLIDLPQEEQRDAAIEELTAGRALKARLEPLVGVKIETSDVVLGSRTAFKAARSYLESLYEPDAGVSDSR
jgi:hypothetical protein